MAANVHLTLVAPDNEKCTVQSGGHAPRNRRPALRRRPSCKVEKWSRSSSVDAGAERTPLLLGKLFQLGLWVKARPSSSLSSDPMTLA